MSHATLDESFVILCDWRGRCVWISARESLVKVGELVWEHLTPKSKKDTKAALGHVVTARECQQLAVVNARGEHFRGWLWPLDSPEVAVCVLGMRVPRNLEALTKRERGVLELLAQGIETRRIARRLDVSVSTIHTHIKRMRVKLGLHSLEALISFAARYAYPDHQPLNIRTVHASKRA